ncbi:uncharacterized protein LOC111685312 [Lucilia cuprina]|uniref:uncharacterized protein LOC111685312 n=1 Tax=Lucilia cuprina TaxID=7375 RepID=UPI001F065F64|nr:uncharacterized protein LOC111685312 [Lucilia cuprina]XP_046801653.1 uncharacterized protein LOC111685312 [Lucilia cuprina]XP_046801654.1 uncharacterized protein LOC111685312 [Lucilia cuprina]XP_046801655.1 uncharacterized protein LOC111685312 [Lucilia cuprina]XP_046801656.1 uncharacterized protein LOC111685312 [Lucilia cuprina]
MLPKSKILHFGLFLFLIINAVQAKPSKDTEGKVETKDDKKNDEFPEEDSDMLMEPNDFGPITILRSQERQFHEPSSTQQFRPLPNARYIARSDVSSAARVSSIDSHSQAAQNYYPPFYREAPPLGHSRPYFPLSDAPIVPKYAEGRPEGNLGPGLPPNQRAAGFDHSILGSGDFGVIRGGTFYPEEEMPYHPEDSIDFVQKYTYPEEQFAHFRDFADINTPVDTAFSHFVVVYQAKNSTKPASHPHPKNIFEQLELLDKEKATEEKKLKKPKHTSKSKTKLAKTKLQQKKYKKKATSSPTTVAKDIEEEPLLALS